MPPKRNKVSKRRRPSIHKKKNSALWRRRITQSSVQVHAKLGLESDPNAGLVPSRASRLQSSIQVQSQLEHATPTWEARPVLVKGYKLSEDDAAYIQPLVRKHGSDYEAMRRDIKLNPQQLTEAKLRKFAEHLTSENEG